ncbi:hypothetical protein NM688_g995 [Phlebia brevispora]|uniref:Uncharacterized protein n=1 Tax=Phlebia brevispora TaxID=194682 RepID=A0ACC1TCJ5_9APHY|nr:hypothetical protein NM688_g995 [Phlebia brevispora]
MKFLNLLPISEEACELAEVLEFQPEVEQFVKDDDLARTLPYCDGLQAALLSGIHDLTDRTIILLARTSNHLEILDCSGCREISDVGVRELAVLGTQLQAVRLNSVVGITDPSVCALVRSLPHLTELELSDLPLVTAASVRDIWTFAKKLRILRLARCNQLTDKGFPHPFPPSSTSDAATTRSAPEAWHALRHKPRISLGALTEHIEPSTWLDALPPLILPDSHLLNNLRLCDLAYCKKITDHAVQGVVAHAPRIHHISLAGCSLVTDHGIQGLCRLGLNLEYVSLAHLERITDRSIVHLVGACSHLKTVDISFCIKLSDLAILELATLPNLRRLSMVGLTRVTRVGLSFLAEHAHNLAHLHISQCTDDSIDLDVIQFLLEKLVHLEYFSGSGVHALTRKGVKRFSESPPSGYDAEWQEAYRVFKGENIANLRSFLQKEERRRKEAELKNIPFVPRSDDSMNLY